MSKPGATIIIVYYLLESSNKLGDWFSAEDIYGLHQNAINTSTGQELIGNLIQRFKKRKDKDSLWAFETAKNLENWLKQHVDKKPQYWFECDGNIRFRLKSDHIHTLKGWTNKRERSFDPKNMRSWGQVCLVLAILLNGLVLGMSLYISSLQGELQTRRYEEQYFINNDRILKSESDRLALLNANSNQLVMLRRLSQSHLTEREIRVVESVVKELNRQQEVSKINTVALTYLLSNDTTEDVNVYKMFESKSDSELLVLQEEYEKQANDYSTVLKKDMVQLMEKISFWEVVHSTMLVLSSIVLIIGNLIIFRSDI